MSQPKTAPLSIRLPGDLPKRLKDHCEAQSLSVSGYIAGLISADLDRAPAVHVDVPLMERPKFRPMPKTGKR